MIVAAERELRVHGFGVQGDRFLEISLGSVRLIGPDLQKGEIEIGLPAIRTECHRLLHLLQRDSEILLSGVEIGQRDVNFGIVGLPDDQQISVLLGLLQVATCDQQVGEIDVGLIILGFNFNRTRQLLIRASPLLQLQIGLRQLIVSLGETRVHLDRVAELDSGFAVLFFFEVTLSTFKILLLAHVGVARTAGQQRHCQSQNQEETVNGGIPHHKISQRAKRAKC